MTCAVVPQHALILQTILDKILPWHSDLSGPTEYCFEPPAAPAKPQKTEYDPKTGPAFRGRESSWNQLFGQCFCCKVLPRHIPLSTYVLCTDCKAILVLFQVWLSLWCDCQASNCNSACSSTIRVRQNTCRVKTIFHAKEIILLIVGNGALETLSLATLEAKAEDRSTRCIILRRCGPAPQLQ